MCVMANEFTGLCATPRLLLMLADAAAGTSFPKHSLQALVTLTLYYLAQPILTIPWSHFIISDSPTWQIQWRTVSEGNGQSTKMNHFKMTLLSNVSNLIHLHHSVQNCRAVPVISYMSAFFSHAMFIKYDVLNSLVLFMLGWESKSI